MNIPLRVRNLVKRHSTTNPFKIAKYENVDVIQWDLPNAIRGFLVRVLRRKIIFVNKNLSELQQLIVICHEIGHAKLHNGYGYYMHADMVYYVSSKREHEANEYALNLLLQSYDIDIPTATKMIQSVKSDPRIVHKMLCDLVICKSFL